MKARLLLLSLLLGIAFAQLHVWSPTVFLHYAVDPTQLRPHIDSRFTISTFGGSAYISLALSNVSTPTISLPGHPYFNGLGFNTYVEYKGAYYINTLYQLFDVDLISLVCDAAVLPPYGCHYSHDMNLTRDDANHFYSFFAKNDNKLGPGAVNVSITWDPNNIVNYTDHTTLEGWLSNPTVSSIYIEAPSPLTPIFYGCQSNFTYTQGLFGCTINSIQSNYIDSVVGKMDSLVETKPAVCTFSPYRTAIFSDALPYPPKICG